MNVSTTQLLYHFIKQHKVDKRSLHNVHRSRHGPPELKLQSQSSSSSSSNSSSNSTSSEGETDTVFPILGHKDVVRSYSTLVLPSTEQMLEARRRRASAAKNCERAGLLLEQQHYDSWLQLQRGVGCSVKVKRLSQAGVERLRTSEHIRPALGVLEFLHTYGKKLKGRPKSALKPSNVRTLTTFNFLATPSSVKVKRKDKLERFKVKLQKFRAPAPAEEPQEPIWSQTRQSHEDKVKVTSIAKEVKGIELLKSRRPAKSNDPDRDKSKARQRSNCHQNEAITGHHRKRSRKLSPGPSPNEGDGDGGLHKARRISNEPEIRKKQSLVFKFDANNNSRRKSLNVTAAGSAQQPTTLLNLFRHHTIPLDFRIPKKSKDVGGAAAAAPPPEPDPPAPAPTPEEEDEGVEEGEIMIDVEGVENVIELQDGRVGGEGEVAMILVLDQRTGAITQVQVSESAQVLEEVEVVEDLEESSHSHSHSHLEEQARVSEAEEYDELKQIERICDGFTSGTGPGSVSGPSCSVEEEECEGVKGVEADDEDEEPRQRAGFYEQGFVDEVESSEEQLRQIAQICAAFEIKSKSEELEDLEVESKSKSTPENQEIGVTVEEEPGIPEDDEKVDVVAVSIEEDEEVAEVSIEEGEEVAEVSIEEGEKEEVSIEEDEEVAEVFIVEGEKEEVLIEEDEEVVAVSIEEDEKVAEVSIEEDEKVAEVSIEEDEEVAEVSIEEGEEVAEVSIKEGEEVAEVSIEEGEKEEVSIEEDEEVAEVFIVEGEKEEVLIEEDEEVVAVSIEEDEKVAEVSIEEDEKVAEVSIEEDEEVAEVFIEEVEEVAEVSIEEDEVEVEVSIAEEDEKEDEVEVSIAEEDEEVEEVRPDEDAVAVAKEVKPDEEVDVSDVELEQDGGSDSEDDKYCFVRRRIYVLNPWFHAPPQMISKDDQVNLPLLPLPMPMRISPEPELVQPPPSIVLSPNESWIPIKKRQSYRLID